MYSDRFLRERKPKPEPMMATSMSEGRKRKANFSVEEKLLLINGYKKYKSVLCRDADTSLERRATLWQDITDRFNDDILERDGDRAVTRTVGEVRKKWRAMCTQARKNRQDMAENNGSTDNYNGWIDKQYELDSEIISLLGENDNGTSDDAWSEFAPDSPVETKWSATLQQSGTPPLDRPHMPPHTLPVKAARRSSYNTTAPPPASLPSVPTPSTNQPGNVTPIILHTESLADPLLTNPASLECVDECDFIRKKRALELEKMQLENSLLRMQLTKAALEVQALKAGLKLKQVPMDE